MWTRSGSTRFTSSSTAAPARSSPNWPSVRELAESSGRPCWLIAESADNDPRVVTPLQAGGLGLDAQWNDDFHHALHAALTGERQGYYGDFGGAGDRGPRHEPGLRLPGPVLGVPAAASRRTLRRARPRPLRGLRPEPRPDRQPARRRTPRLTRAHPGRLRLAAALLLLSPGIPLLFMGEEYGETAPFPYFVDHGDPRLLEAVRRGQADRAPARCPVTSRTPPTRRPSAAAVLDRRARHQGRAARPVAALPGADVAASRAETPLRRSARECDRGARGGSRRDAGTDARGGQDRRALQPLRVRPRRHAAGRGLLDGSLVPDPTAAPDGAAVTLGPWGFRVFRTGTDRDGDQG